MPLTAAAAALLAAWTAVLAASPGAALASGGAAGPAGPAIEAAWARASIGGSKVSAVYLSLTNRGDAPLRLVGAETDRAGHATLHRTVLEDGIAKMRHVPELHVPPGGSVRFEPGGLHVMLTGLPSPLETGDTLALTLLFEGGRRLTTPVPVRTAADGDREGREGSGDREGREGSGDREGREGSGGREGGQ